MLANDHNAYAHTLATCYVQADAERWAETARRILDDLSRLPGRAGWFTETYCVALALLPPRRMASASRRCAMPSPRSAPEPELEAVLLTSLLEAADRVDSTAGLQMAYMKQMGAARAEAPRAPPAGAAAAARRRRLRCH